MSQSGVCREALLHGVAQGLRLLYLVPLPFWGPLQSPLLPPPPQAGPLMVGKREGGRLCDRFRARPGRGVHPTRHRPPSQSYLWASGGYWLDAPFSSSLAQPQPSLHTGATWVLGSGPESSLRRESSNPLQTGIGRIRLCGVKLLGF